MWRQLWVRRGVPLSRRWFTSKIEASDVQRTATAEVPETFKPLSPLQTQKLGMFLEPGILFKDHKRRKIIIFKLYFFSILSVTIILTMIKIVPPGYVGMIVRRDGTIDQFNNEGRISLFYIPFLEVPVAFRVTPIRKKIMEKFTTKDGQQVEVVIFFDLQAKLAFASHIYTIYGVNYSKEFVEKELMFDVEQVVKKFDKSELLIQSDEVERLFSREKKHIATLKTHKATEEIIERFEDAGAFNKIIVSKINVSFRDPSFVPNLT
ncbi:SPFH domain / Band 7 family protein [Babesia bovis T2Bo]|uniref:SPFH domain / Band 7 family protein n=1 Tax=Babesia bovis T2Bo TaxID=484906 RepID=UPI001C355AEA|nr:SPFH domain / Band 7 family protein [Babesia bovis T2Bo]EDO06387.2 SPFH domain / Band 7 family protein [Babesia bovis T2Bo]